MSSEFVVTFLLWSLILVFYILCLFFFSSLVLLEFSNFIDFLKEATFGFTNIFYYFSVFCFINLHFDIYDIILSTWILLTFFFF